LLESGLAIPDYIDISGETREVRHANEFWDHYGVAVHSGLHQSGDLVFFSRNGFFPTHIGIVRDEESYIHSPGKDNAVVTASAIVEEEITSSIKVNVRRLFSTNPIGYKSPTISLPKTNYRYTQRPL